MRQASTRRLYSLILILFLLLGAEAAHAQQGWNVQLVSSIKTGGTATAVCVANGMAYVADGPGGLKIIDVSNPAKPFLRGSYAITGNACEVAVKGAAVYLAEEVTTMKNVGGTYVFDVRNPAKPIPYKFLKSTSVWSGDSGVAISGSRLFTAGQNSDLPSYINRLFMYDISNPLHPVLKNFWDLGGSAERICATDNLLAVAHDTTGAMIFDIAKPDFLHLQGIQHTNHVSDVAFLGADVVFSTINSPSSLPANVAGIQILMIEQSTVTPRGAFYVRHSVNGICTRGNMIYAACDGNEMLIIDARDLDHLVEKGKYITTAAGLDVTTDDKYIYVANGKAGLTILRYTGATATPANSNARLQTGNPQP